MTEERPTIFTIGHSTHSIDAFIAMLRAHGIAELVDIRSMPRSRFNPHYNGHTLQASLEAAGIAYTHMKSLGGLRRAREDSVNKGFRNGGFRGYADYMQTPEFETALANLVALARERRVAIMCAEAAPTRCHRSLVSDALTVRGVSVEHILSETQSSPHALTEFAAIDGERITYPSREPELLLF